MLTVCRILYKSIAAIRQRLMRLRPRDGAVDVRELGADPLLRLAHRGGHEGVTPLPPRVYPEVE